MEDNGGRPPPLRLTPLNRVLSPPLNLHPPNTPPDLYASALDHFTSIPWCAKLLLLALPPSSSSDTPPPAPIPFIPQCFNPLTPRHDQLVGATLARPPRGITHLLSVFHPHDAAHARDPGRPIPRVHTLVSLGDGLSGYEAIAHGGLTATLADEAMGAVNEINTALGKHGLVHQRSSVTAALHLRYLRAVPLPAVVCLTAWTEAVEGRKTRMRCEVKDGAANVLAEASSTWVALGPSL